MNTGSLKKFDFNKRYRLFVLTEKIPILIMCFVSLTFGTLRAQDDKDEIILVPQNRAIVQRCFLELDGVKKTFCVAVGEPNKVHYALDLSTGAIVKIWKGDFLEATTMWTGRGQEQLAEPLGNKILTIKSNSSILFENGSKHKNANQSLEYKGYTLDVKGSPTFKYANDGIEVEDRIWSTVEDTQKLHRDIRFSLNSSNGENIKYRLAQGASIRKIKKNVYSINDKSYIITISSKLKSEPEIQNTSHGQDLVIPLSSIKNSDVLEYYITW
ncbi:hypothetical protein [Arenibacter sp. ARW7G5Y1]|uniref:hypothetical protein n=1 Tax=Arenibacter sp. ARW7G5Y1 TaxID=2135619 RepID=UPI000D755EDE|nr:hypothetical protein [Arenibacter sp. ARW7G5Y1]PXX30385.1 hypothetical protein C7972_1028 [Arenibacter sp. ARW7G5Y1]